MGWIAMALSGVLARTPAQESTTPRLQQVIAVLAPAADSPRLALLAQGRDRLRAGAGPAELAAIHTALAQAGLAAKAGFVAAAARLPARVLRQWWIVDAVAVEVAADRIPSLWTCPGVVAVEPVRTWRPHVGRATNAANHDADYVQSQLGLFGANATLALLDSGIDRYSGQTNAVHPAFAHTAPKTGTRLLGAFDLDKTRVPADPEDPDGHGTAVAAIAIGKDWGASIPVRSDDGFAPQSELVSYRITVDVQGNTNDIVLLDAWQQVAQDAATYNLKVAINSFSGSPFPSHPVQIALDTVAYFADVLVVTSAGNLGEFLSPTSQSQANCNGIAVGGLVGDTHLLDPLSSYGPLKGDPLRYFPDIAAISDSAWSALVDQPTRTKQWAGTSFAAPMVAGTALLIRAVQPQLTATEAKAIVLNNVQDLSAVNPNANRNNYGLGMLRTDHVVLGAQQGNLIRGKVVRDISERQLFPIPVTKDEDYAATLAWPRTYFALPSREYANLDLRIFDANQNLLAVADSPRNLYERVVFRAAATATYTLEITASDMTEDELEFALAWGKNRGGGRQPGTYRLYGTACAGTGPDPALGTVQPPPARGAYVAGSTKVPFDHTVCRLLQAYDGTSFPAGGMLLEQLAFRRDDEQAETPSYQVLAEVFLGYTAKPAHQLDRVFDANYAGPKSKVVATRWIDLPGTQGLPYAPNHFDWLIPLDAPFLLQPAPGQNVLVEIKVHGSTLAPNSPPVLCDALREPSGVSRVYATSSAQAPFGDLDFAANVIAFVPAGLAGATPNLQAAGVPQLGGTFAVVLRNARPNAPAFLAHGTSRSAWASLPLPFDLTALGAPGCALATDYALTLPLTIAVTGQGKFVYTIPNLPVLTGQNFCNQGLILDAAANALGMALTNGGIATIGG